MTTINEPSVCAVCHKEATVKSLGPLDLVSEVECLRCGRFKVSDLAVIELHDRKLEPHLFKISAYLRERTISKQPLTTIVTTQASVGNIPGPATDIENILASFPNSVSMRLERALQNLSRLSSYPGERFRLNLELDYPVFFTENAEACGFIGKTLEDESLISTNNTVGHINGLLTAKGWNRIAQIEKAIGSSNQAFVAMWFNGALEEAYKDGFTRAVGAAGYKALRIDLKEHNEKICDAIVAEIRKSRFVIADFTGHRGGVYFEAGFAMGLGIPVIWTCRNDDKDSLHFDTRQFNHILWNNPQDLYEKLYRRIEATITR